MEFESSLEVLTRFHGGDMVICALTHRMAYFSKPQLIMTFKFHNCMGSVIIV